MLLLLCLSLPLLYYDELAPSARPLDCIDLGDWRSYEIPRDHTCEEVRYLYAACCQDEGCCGDCSLIRKCMTPMTPGYWDALASPEPLASPLPDIDVVIWENDTAPLMEEAWIEQVDPDGDTFWYNTITSNVSFTPKRGGRYDLTMNALSELLTSMNALSELLANLLLRMRGTPANATEPLRDGSAEAQEYALW